MKNYVFMVGVIAILAFQPLHLVQQSTTMVQSPTTYTQTISVAVYDTFNQHYAEEIYHVLEYSWSEGQTTYTLQPILIDKKDVLTQTGHHLCVENFDVLFIPGSGSPYVDAFNSAWKQNVKSFVENGGGYVGVCGGANLASMGFQDPGINAPLNLSVLEIANIFVNNQQMEEWQYLWKSEWLQGGPPIDLYIPESNNPITQGLYDSYRNVRYWGGPGMIPANKEDPKLGGLTPLAIYAEEPMDVAPIHYWHWKEGAWHIRDNVTTDLKGQLAGVATNYGKGKIALFGPHPERATFNGGHIEEGPVRENMRGLTWFIYNWSGGKQTAESYNWWMLRRSVAWAANAPIPPVSQLAVFIENPQEGQLYINDVNRITPFHDVAFVVGELEINSSAVNSQKQEIYLDGKMVGTSENTQSTLLIDLEPGKHELQIVALCEGQKAWHNVSLITV